MRSSVLDMLILISQFAIQGEMPSRKVNKEAYYLEGWVEMNTGRSQLSDI